MYIRFFLYFFSFLTSESLINSFAAEIFETDKVNYIYAVGLLFTALGYVLFSLIKDKKYGYLGQTIALISLIGVFKSTNNWLFLLSAYSLLISLGYIGGYIHYLLSFLLDEKHFSIKTSFFAACGVLLQYFFQNHLDSLIMYGLIVSFIFLMPLKPRVKISSNNSKYTSTKSLLIIVVISIFIMSIILGFQDSFLTLENAKGEVLLFSKARLLYAVGLIIAGIISDYKNFIFLPLASACSMIISIVAISFFNHFTLSMSLMYVYSGFYVMYLTLIPISLAANIKNREMYTGIGRITRSISSSFVVLITTILNNYISQYIYVLLTCFLSIFIIVLMAFSGLFKFDKKECQINTLREKLEIADKKFNLTLKEKEVLEKLVTNEKTVQEIAEELGISRRVLQRHIASLYEKMNVQTRVGLLMVLNEIKK